MSVLQRQRQKDYKLKVNPLTTTTKGGFTPLLPPSPKCSIFKRGMITEKFNGRAFDWQAQGPRFKSQHHKTLASVTKNKNETSPMGPVKSTWVSLWLGMFS